jgi:V8-like Glu-specific endopeptidase
MSYERYANISKVVPYVKRNSQPRSPFGFQEGILPSLTVLIRLCSGADVLGFGSGFLIGKNFVVTAKHVLSIPYQYLDLRIGRGDGSISGDQLSVINGVRSENYDLAVLKLGEPQNAWFEFDNAPLLDGERLSMAGYGEPGSDGHFWCGENSGTVSSIEGDEFGHDINTYVGDSGAPIYRLANGKAVVSGMHLSGEKNDAGGFNRALILNGAVSAELERFMMIL